MAGWGSAKGASSNSPRPLMFIPPSSCSRSMRPRESKRRPDLGGSEGLRGGVAVLESTAREPIGKSGRGMTKGYDLFFNLPRARRSPVCLALTGRGGLYTAESGLTTSRPLLYICNLFVQLGVSVALESLVRRPGAGDGSSRMSKLIIQRQEGI